MAASFLGRSALAAPLEAYGTLPSIESVSISPDGAMLAVAVTDGEQRRIVIRQIAPEKLLRVINAGSQKVRDVRWAGAGHVIITTSTAGFIPGVDSARLESMMATDFNLASMAQQPLLGGELVATNDDILTTIDSLPTVRVIDGKPFVFVTGTHFVSGQGEPALFKVDLRSATAKIEAPGLSSSRQFVVGGSTALAEDDYDGASGKWTLRVWKGHHWEVVRQETALDEPPQLVGPGRDGSSMLVRFHKDHLPLLVELDAKDEPTAEPLPMQDADSELYDGATNKLIGQTALYGDEQRYVFFDPHDAAVWKAITAAYPGGRVGLVDFDSARDKYVVRVDSPMEGPAYALVDMAAKHASWIGAEYLGLKPADISPVRAITFKAADGLDLSGYLTLPAGKGAKGLPLVVLVHGGPAERDLPGFDWWSQALASRGYAVLRVNYRGSGGLSWGLQAAGFGQWGRKMQTDLSDGVRYLAREDVIDPKRVCIAGGSYGGYGALAGATLDTGVYRCAASIAGPSDLTRMVNWDKAQETSHSAAATERYWTRYMGAMNTLDQISPAKHADKVSIPILLIHGRDDTVVAYQQSEIMADALTKAGKPYEFVTLKAEDHWLSRGATRLEMLQALTAFLEKNNPPG
jgi:dipeptidyl aminopeptidase/acylaminoacyl peptidase